MSGVCPCCGQMMPEADTLVVSLDRNTAARLGKVIHLTPRMTEILVALHRRYPASVNVGGLYQAIYGHTEEPSSGYTCLKVHISYLRQRLAQIGVEVAVTYKVGWRLEFHDKPFRILKRKRALHAEAA